MQHYFMKITCPYCKEKTIHALNFKMDSLHKESYRQCNNCKKDILFELMVG